MLVRMRLDKVYKRYAAVAELVDAADLGSSESIVICKKPQNSNLYPTSKIVTEVLSRLLRADN